MKNKSALLVAVLAFFASGSPSIAADDIPDFLKEVVLNAAPPPTKQQLAFTAVYQLNNSMFNIYDNSLAIYQKNIRARVPLITPARLPASSAS